MRRSRGRNRRRERGAYTAELAVALPSLLFVFAAGLLGIATADAQLRCDDATRAGARALARGEVAAAVTAVTREAAPRGAEVTVRREAGVAEVRCRARVRFAGLHTFQVSARSVAAVEDAEIPGEGA
ncbi:MAG: hypothetical protein J2P14_02545 [Acidothermales bacterium]|nr:hypothetical protein [Acidothermales bacterium]